MLLNIVYFLIALGLLLIQMTIIYYIWDLVERRLKFKHQEPSISDDNISNKVNYRQPFNSPLEAKFQLDIKGVCKTFILTKDNFQELLEDHFVAVGYLFELWIRKPFHLTITDRINKHYGKSKAIHGFIRYGQVSEIFIAKVGTKKQRTGTLLHEIAHDIALQKAKHKNIKIQSHGKEFQKELQQIFKPILVDNTYFKKHLELSDHLKYEPKKYSPHPDLCV